MMESWHSYPSIFALGHKAIAELLLDAVLVEEKIDGSQFSFGPSRHSLNDSPNKDGELAWIIDSLQRKLGA